LKYLFWTLPVVLCLSNAFAISPANLFSDQQGQRASPAPSSPTTTASKSSAAGQRPTSGTTKSEKEQELEKKEQSQRVLGIVPEFGVTNRMNAPPLSPKQKFHLFVKSAFDPATLGIVGVQAALSQAENEFPGYGQGAAGYGKRYGAALADEVSSGFFSNFAYPVLLKEDPRYFRLGTGTYKHRLFYSLKQEFVAHTDSGGRRFDFSNVLGAFTSGGISNIYYPQSDRGFELTMSRSAIALGYGSLGALFDEFWPDIHAKVFRKH
jgi:hypothetical protein